jgi:hypothetical protein
MLVVDMAGKKRSKLEKDGAAVPLGPAAFEDDPDIIAAARIEVNELFAELQAEMAAVREREQETRLREKEATDVADQVEAIVDAERADRQAELQIAVELPSDDDIRMAAAGDVDLLRIM